MDIGVETLVPLGLFTAIAVTMISWILMHAKVRLAQQETLRAAIEAGQRLDDSTLKLLLEPPTSPETDLRSGSVTICGGVGIGLAAGVAHVGIDETFATVLSIVAIVVASVGAGRVIASKVGAPRADAHADAA